MIRILLVKLFDLDASGCDWEKKRDLTVELFAGEEKVLSPPTFADVVDEIEINQQCYIDKTKTSHLYLVVKQDEVMTNTIVSKIKIPIPQETCSKLFRLVHYRPTESKTEFLGKVRIGFQYLQESKDVGVSDRIDRIEMMIQSFQRQMEKLQTMQQTLNQLQQEIKTHHESLPPFLSFGNIPPVILRSVASAKQLRINVSGQVDARGNYGHLALFKINRLTNNDIRLQSNSNKKRFVRIDGMNVDGLGGQGNLTTFKLHHMGKRVFAFESKQFKNHYLASDDNGRCHVVIGDQPNITRFVMIVTGEVSH